MTLKAAKKKNDEVFYKWLLFGRPEAFSELNDSNRDLILAYLEENPNAVGYKIFEGIVELKNNPLYNFSCDYLFDRSLTEKVKNIKPINIDNVLNEKNSLCIIWS